MQAVDSIVVTPEMRVAVDGLVDRLGSFVLVSTPMWEPLGQALGLDVAAQSTGATLLVGSPAEVLRHVSHSHAEFGFVVAVAQATRWWQRAPSWRDQTMLNLWSAGWTPVAIDRIVTANRNAGVEFVVGNARPTPTITDEERRPSPR